MANNSRAKRTPKTKTKTKLKNEKQAMYYNEHNEDSSGGGGGGNIDFHLEDDYLSDEYTIAGDSESAVSLLDEDNDFGTFASCLL